MPNLVFIAGPQGAGKTTLVSLLCGPDIFMPELKTKTISLELEPLSRLALKICQRSLENVEYMQIAQQHPDKVIIGNRCIYDQEAFNEVYLKRGWLDEETAETYRQLTKKFYLPELQEPFALILNPGFGVVQQHLKQRWKSEGAKWRETDTEYIRLACEAYEQFKGREKIYYIDHEIDLKSEHECKAIINWLHEVREIQLG
ncbi:deoxynucleoside kinase [Candidatus Pacearchaeota archaeon]|nr:deoxynucleoside kinase [Candidatus Pacearchaeota archaeon]